MISGEEGAMKSESGEVDQLSYSKLFHSRLGSVRLVSELNRTLNSEHSAAHVQDRRRDSLAHSSTLCEARNFDELDRGRYPKLVDE